MKAPFPYFGGKAKIAHQVWAALGNPKHYIEPFFGSGAVLLNRPTPHNTCETVNDKDGFVCNVWRALKLDPDTVSNWADWPVNHADLIARKKALLTNEQRLLDGLIADPKWFDAELAGYWIWAASCWIGSGLTSPGQLPHIIDKGKGINSKSEGIRSWFRQLQERLLLVRVVCGEWDRVCGGNWQDGMGDCGIFFDPPYSVETRRQDVYHHDSIEVASAVREWCLARGDKPTYRICLAGYFEEHQELLNHGWRVETWKAQGGYANLGAGETQGKKNAWKEALFYSPHCLENQLNLFDLHKV